MKKKTEEVKREVEPEKEVLEIKTKVEIKPISDEEIHDSQSVLKFRERWKLQRATKIKRWLISLFVLASFVVGMYFIFIAMNIDLLDVFRAEENNRTTFTLEGGMALVIFLFLLIFIFESIVIGFVPGTTTIFISIIAMQIFENRWYIVFPVVAVGIVISSIFLYFIGRYAGRKILFWLFKKEELEKRLDWIAKHGTKGVPWLFLIPFFPGDLICIACGASKMKFWHFFLVVIVFRPIEVLLLVMYRIIFDAIGSQEPVIQFLIINMIVINIVLLAIYHKVLLSFFNRSVERLNFKKKYEQALAKEVAIERERLEKERMEAGLLTPEECAKCESLEADKTS